MNLTSGSPGTSDVVSFEVSDAVPEFPLLESPLWESDVPLAVAPLDEADEFSSNDVPEAPDDTAPGDTALGDTVLGDTVPVGPRLVVADGTPEVAEPELVWLEDGPVPVLSPVLEPAESKAGEVPLEQAFNAPNTVTMIKALMIGRVLKVWRKDTSTSCRNSRP